MVIINLRILIWERKISITEVVTEEVITQKALVISVVTWLHNLCITLLVQDNIPWPIMIRSTMEFPLT